MPTQNAAPGEQPTPGPWHIVSEREDELKVKGPQDEWVADCADGFWSDEHGGWIMAVESKPNARLIAAAPELLEALEREMDREKSRYGSCTQAQEFFRQNNAHALAAIAKARGQ